MPLKLCPLSLQSFIPVTQITRNQILILTITTATCSLDSMSSLLISEYGLIHVCVYGFIYNIHTLEQYQAEIYKSLKNYIKVCSSFLCYVFSLLVPSTALRIC